MFKSARYLSIAALVLLVGCSSLNPASKTSTFSANTSAPPTPSAETTLSETLPDTLVLPGERVGPIARNTTRKDLSKLFGEARLTDEEVQVGEGFTEPATRVDLGTERSFTVVWADTNRNKPVEVRNFGTAWQTPQGIGVGTPFAQLQEKLGQFELYGFAWDYGGTVVLEGTKLAQYRDMLILRLQPAANAAERSPRDFKAVMGDSTFSSTNRHLPSLKLKVEEMIVRLVPYEQ